MHDHQLSELIQTIERAMACQGAAIVEAIKRNQITQTRFMSLELVKGMISGVPLGQGACKGVRLSANHFISYSNTPQSTLTAAKFYYGDKDQQSKEYLVNTNTTAGNTNNRSTDWLPCTDLQEIWVRFSDSAAGTPDTLVIEVEIGD